MNFDLPPTGTEQTPAFVDPKGCQDWLSTVPIANAVAAQSSILRQLSLLHRFTLPAAERFALLETLRGPLGNVQEDASKKFAGKPLPLAPHEQAAVDITLNIWYELALGYLRCFDDFCGGMSSPAGLSVLHTQCVANPEQATRAAVLVERVLATFADWQIDLYRAGQSPAGGYWQQLNQTFAAGEALGVAARAIPDPVRHGKANTSALAAFSECCLLSTANIYELPARHLAWVARWARRWGVKLTLLTAPPEDIRNRAVPLWVDLGSDRAPGYTPESADGGRWLETTELRKSIVARIALLEQGRSPADLQLGDDVTQPAATLLLQRALQRWCKGGVARRQERHPAIADCRVVPGLESVHFELSGRQAFRAPTRSVSTLRREREEFETFGAHSQRANGTATKDESHIENWRVLDQSTAGLRITRLLKEGARVGAGQMVAVKTADGQYFVLGNVRWALREGDSALVAGIQLFPGEARSATVRVVHADGTRDGWRPGFLLPAIPAIHESASVIVPAGTFMLDRSIEILVDQEQQTLKLFRVLDRSIEFERCNYYD
ncbi:hypothetical protein [Sulfuritalea sp.]|uniref:hypothetical protein n=1 Tax=Sulfuritalea sp. TaxID=2480090 RepID=UPI001AC065FF|nr:hypothetical protein [Sulfuritalea sp.]MBN8476009.1 hypothetical protein [Sulfuritalea sp.]